MTCKTSFECYTEFKFLAMINECLIYILTNADNLESIYGNSYKALKWQALWQCELGYLDSYICNFTNMHIRCYYVATYTCTATV